MGSLSSLITTQSFRYTQWKCTLKAISGTSVFWKSINCCSGSSKISNLHLAKEKNSTSTFHIEILKSTVYVTSL